MNRRSWPWMLVAVALALSASVARPAGITYELLPPSRIAEADTTDGANVIYTRTLEIPADMRLSALALEVFNHVTNDSSKTKWCGYEVYPMTSLGHSVADSTGLSTGNDYLGHALHVRERGVDSLSYFPVDMDDSNTKLDGFFCTNVDSMSMAVAGKLILMDSTWVSGSGGHFDSTNTFAQRGNWRQYVSSRIIYSTLHGTSKVLATGAGGLTSYRVRWPGMFAPQPFSITGSLGPNNLVPGLVGTDFSDVWPSAWFYMPLADGYGGRIDLNRVMVCVVNRVRGGTASTRTKIAVYAVCTPR